MSTAAANFNDPREDSLTKSLAEREAAIKERLSAAWQLHIARVQEELESGWQSHIAMAVEGALVNLQEPLRGEIQESARHIADSQLEEVRRSNQDEVRLALDEARHAAEDEKQQAMETLRAELAEQHRQEADRAQEGFRQQMQTLHKAVRRSENAEGRDDVIAALLDGIAPYAERAVLVQLDGDMIGGICGVTGSEDPYEMTSLEIPVEQAPALHNAKQSAEPLVAMRLESEFSRELLGYMGEAADEKIRVFPVLSRGLVKALVLAEAGSKPFHAGCVEILTMAAGHKWTAGKEAAEPAQLIAIQGTQEAKPKENTQNWFHLSPQEQEVHLRGQRFARVQVAELRLYQSERVRQSRRDNNIYGVFRNEIDQAREEFRTQFVESCPSMLDYYHMELVRILANENEKVLGPDYPGPLV
ncbi:MAG: hypothetical protein U5J83_08870 [Bryobacterales bacterium]|nr:hypothetical protein [Bryobacterales bacterium]